MNSKFDSYWWERRNVMARLIAAAAEGRSTLFDVTDIRPLGERRSWYGKAIVRGKTVLHSSMAHMTSLAHLVVDSGICVPFPDLSFTFVMDRKGRLRVSAGAVAGESTLTREKASAVAPPAPVTTVSSPSPELACRRLHQVLQQLPTYTEPNDVPFDDGLYFFYEGGESSEHAPNGRVVRIGNHPLSNHRLVDRLQEHYRSRVGAKNGSVFRRYLGGALIRRDDEGSDCLSPRPGFGHWERQHDLACAMCQPYEPRVSEVLRTNFRFRCVRVEDQLLRNELERRLIATVARCRVCRPSDHWLGRFAYPAIVRETGLWNTQHFNGPTMTEDHLTILEQLVSETAGVSASPSLATTLLLIPCSAAKAGGLSLRLRQRGIEEFVSPEAYTQLTEGRRRTFARTSIDMRGLTRPALEMYSGFPFATRRFRQLLVQRLQQGLHCLIVSGGYGLLRPEEPIHRYEAHLQQTASIWRSRFPSVLRDYVKRNGIRRTLGAFSSSYAALIPEHLSGDDWRFVPRFTRGVDRGSAMRVVPERVGEALVEVLDKELVPTGSWRRT